LRCFARELAPGCWPVRPDSPGGLTPDTHFATGRGSFIAPVSLAHVPDPPISLAWPGWGRREGPNSTHGVLPFAVLILPPVLALDRLFHPTCRSLPLPSVVLLISTGPAVVFFGSHFRGPVAGIGIRLLGIPAGKPPANLAGRYCRGLLPLPGFQTLDGHSPFIELAVRCAGRVSSPWPAVSLRKPLPVPSAHELGRLGARSSASCRD